MTRPYSNQTEILDGVAHVTMRRFDGTKVVAMIDEADIPLIEGRNVYALKGSNYVLVWDVEAKRPRRLHRLILNAPDGVEVDHANRNPLDNRRCNLRIATKSQNIANSRSKPNKSGYIGVRIDRRGAIEKYDAFCAGKFISRHGDIEEAARAVDAAAIARYGSGFAKLNFPQAAL